MIYNPLSSARVLSNGDDKNVSQIHRHNLECVSISNGEAKNQIIGKAHLRSVAVDEEEESSDCRGQGSSPTLGVHKRSVPSVYLCLSIYISIRVQKRGVHKRSVPELACALACNPLPAHPRPHALACALACALAVCGLAGRSVWSTIDIHMHT